MSIGVNRRQIDPADSTAVLGVNETGPRDGRVEGLHLAGGGESIVLLEYACHPYVLGPDDTLLSPDFWGHAAAALLERGHQAIYLNGCSGDIAPRAAFRGPAAARDVGEELASAVLRACENERIDDDAGLSVGSAHLKFPHDALPPMDQIAIVVVVPVGRIGKIKVAV